MSELTIIIPTHNRPKLFEKLISYWSNQNDKYKFIIADSSDEETKKKNKININKYLPSAQIFYSPSNENPELKFYNAIKNAATEFLIINPDDDFILKNALIKNLKKIKKNKNINLINCNHFGYKYDGVLSLCGVYTNHIFKKKKFCKRLYLAAYSKNATPLIYSLHRKKLINNILDRYYKTRLIIGNGMHNGNFFEHFIQAELILRGNLIISNDVLFFRNESEMSCKQIYKNSNLFRWIKYNFNALFIKRLYLKILFYRLTKLKKINTSVSKNFNYVDYKKVLIRFLKKRILAPKLVYYKNFDVKELNTIEESYACFIKDKAFLENHLKNYNIK
jgi:glycosyltransferase domain-containing protein